MAENTEISWCDHTYNAWEGCQKVGPGCDHCYAEGRNKRFAGGANWGPGAPRRRTSVHTRNLLRRLDRQHDKFFAEYGRHQSVFCSSLSDVFDNAVPEEWRREMFFEIERAPNLDVILLTKRIGNVEKMVPWHWDGEIGHWPRRVGLMITVVNQEEADRDIPKLLDLKARLDIPWVGLSMEPLLGPVDLGQLQESIPNNAWLTWLDGLDWIIVGGESGPNARPMHPDWARDLRDQCAVAGVPYHFKQWGEWAPTDDSDELMAVPPCRRDFLGRDIGEAMFRVGKKAAGRLLDGKTHDEFPRQMRRA